MLTLFLFAFIAIAVSFFCSVLEAALLSITPSYIAQQKLEHPRLHDRLKALKERIDQPLAAILTLNTVAHTVGATGVGAQVTVVFGNGYLGIASAVMTVLVLILSEIIPKTLGARYWRSLAPLLPVVLNSMILMLKPFIWLSRELMKLIGGSTPQHDIRQEIKALTVLGREIEVLDDDEQRVIANMLDLHDVKAVDIMTPRTVCETARPEDPLDAFVERVKKLPFSRYPVLDEQETPLGLVFRSDLLDIGEHTRVADIMRPLKVVSDQASAEYLMTQLMQERQHLCVIYDEYGSWLGLVTLEDILETIIGKSIMDEFDDIPNMRRHAKRRWQRRMKAASDSES
ncbi:MAG: DUF21 domain-containing protein [Halioglobus sp.]|nr:DUF21 domain-containing protein [Halioglobus sp.]